MKEMKIPAEKGEEAMKRNQKAGWSSAIVNENSISRPD